MNVKDKPNKVSATLKVIVTGEFYDDDTTEETLRFAVEQDLEDAGFDVDVSLLKEQEPREWIYCEDDSGQDGYRCSGCGFFEPWYYNYTNHDFIKKYQFCPSCGAKMKERTK